MQIWYNSIIQCHVYADPAGSDQDPAALCLEVFSYIMYIHYVQLTIIACGTEQFNTIYFK